MLGVKVVLGQVGWEPLDFDIGFIVGVVIFKLFRFFRYYRFFYTQSMVDFSDDPENGKKIFYILQTIQKTDVLGKRTDALSNGDFIFILRFADFGVFVVLLFRHKGNGFAYASAF